jgi:hypothetical protein
VATIDVTTLPREYWSTALPTSGTFNLGDRIKLTDGTSTYGCTTAGTAGSTAVFTAIGSGGGGTQTVWTAYKTADTTINNSTTLTADPHLTVSLAVGSYAVEAWLHYEATTAADISMAWNTPTASTLYWSSESLPVNATTAGSVTGRGRLTTGQSAVLGGIGAAVVADATPVGYLVLTNAGTVAIKWAQTTADVSDAIVHIGSWLRFTKLA